MIITKFLCSSMMSLVGLKVVKNISGSKSSLISIKSIILMLLLILIPPFIHTGDYSYFESIIVYTITIIAYKEILNISFIKSILSCGIMLLTLLFLDVFLGLIVTVITPINHVRNLWYANLLINISFSVIMLFAYNLSIIKSKLPLFVRKIENKNAIKIVIALILVVITMFIILYTLTTQVSVNDIFTSNFLLFIVFFLLIVMLLEERKNFENLSEEYDNLFNYVQIFEDWIEKEQLIRHEYKNQLAVLRNLTKEKKAKNKIDSIIDDFINIDNQIITELKSLPNGGLKGLLYYKLSVAKKNKLNITIDVDNLSGRVLSKMSEDKLKILTKLLGIYIDNAIEASIDTKKKIIAIEIYKLNSDIKIVISNTFNSENNIFNRNKKGVSTKGAGRGNGLYFANKLISMHKWISENQEILDNFYIQSLIIKNEKV